MNVARWIVGTIVFLLLLLLSLQNAELVTVRFYHWFSWQAPLIFLLLIAFAGRRGRGTPGRAGACDALEAAGDALAARARAATSKRRAFRRCRVSGAAHSGFNGL